jgi:hypothetical protein
MAVRDRIVRVSFGTIASHTAGRIGIFPQGLKIGRKRLGYFVLMSQLLRQRNNFWGQRVFKKKPFALRRVPRKPLKPVMRKPLFRLRRIA